MEQLLFVWHPAFLVCLGGADRCVAVVNFIQQDLPPGSRTGAGFSGQSGALGMGQRASTGLTTCIPSFP